MKRNVNLYDLMQINKATHYHNSKYIPENYKLLYSSNKLGLSVDGYFGIAVVDHAKKQLVICNAGTKIDKKDIAGVILDVVSDIQIFNKETPEQYKHALKFANKALTAVGKDYEIVVTGFSLGSVLADLVTYNLLAKHADIKSITFENPGSLEIIEKQFNVNIKGLKENFEVYNAAVPNLVNLFGHKNQIGDTHRVCLDRSKFTDDMGKIGNIFLAGHAFANFADGAFDDNNHIKLCGANGVLEEIIDNLGAMFS